jgi:hypothetical protein
VVVNTQEIILTDLPLNNATDAKALPGPIRQTHRKGAGYWADEHADHKPAVANQHLSGSNTQQISIAETAMYWVKQLFGGTLKLRDNDGQVAEALDVLHALRQTYQKACELPER